MDIRSLIGVFATVFLAELGDKTQLATMLFAAKNPQAKWLVFAAAAAALVLAAGLGVVVGGFIAQNVNTNVLTRVVGVAFILIGAWTLWRG
jgi:putative Ca2+/H+ antiporter (TMEM165/GDT1 family)